VGDPCFQRDQSVNVFSSVKVPWYAAFAETKGGGAGAVIV
jgi:hypothetical protein